VSKSIKFLPDDHVVIDRLLSVDIFETAIGYMLSDWATLIDSMYNYKF